MGENINKIQNFSYSNVKKKEKKCISIHQSCSDNSCMIYPLYHHYLKFSLLPDPCRLLK